jgi:hypothetical protein
MTDSDIVLRERRINPRVAKHAAIRDSFSVLCSRFNIDAELKFSHGRKFSIFNSKENAIILGAECINPYDALIHQAAHAWIHQNSVNRKPHNDLYLECLWEMILFLYKDPTKYAWYDEYDNKVWTFGRNRTRSWLMDRR